ncbi:MAG: hypothetical protein EOT04_03055 [Candidatus Chaera renei]|uniref:Uncharacterized protein n=1 Tax=Candidatus Chaera renei TaxID=2506947 RepID=A0A4Q0AFZ0_9BACT|nr:MAG: hypothetical protein EOT04_03055 [Candidatus Chaera renei]
MTTAERVGLLWPFGYVLNWPLWGVALFAFMATPGMMIFIIVSVEGRRFPWRPSEQFLGFIPGDLFLGTFFVYAAWLARRLPETTRFYNSGWFQWTLLAAFAAGATALYLAGFGLYTASQMRSPSKLYHDFLYFWYGYMVAATFVAALFATAPSFSATALVSLGMAWLALVMYDSTTGARNAPVKARSAHWEFDWRSLTASPPPPPSR